MPASKSSNPIRFKREIHFDTVESILYLEPNGRHHSVHTYRPSRTFRYHPYSQFRQRYITVDADMRVISNGYEDDLRVIFRPYLSHSINEETVPPPIQPAAPRPGRLRRLATWLLSYIFPNIA